MATPPDPNITMDFDPNSGRAIPAPGPWQQILRDRHARKQPPTTPAATRRTPPRSVPRPQLPDSDYKIIYRPQAGFRVASWSDRQVSQGIQKASNIPEAAFYARVTIQTQAVQNLIIASTPDEAYALALNEITSIQLGATTQEVLPYLKPLPGTSRGVITGLDPNTTNEQLPYILSANGPRILHARMLGTSTSALITFEGVHVPFYIKAYGLLTRCRPYRQTIQYCTLCGELGHRRDVCPNPDVAICQRCHVPDPQPDHDCKPMCQLCGLDHLTASRECKKKLRPPPPTAQLRHKFPNQNSHRPAPNYNASQQQRQTVNQTNTTHQVSWSAIVAPPLTARTSFPPLPTPAAPAAPTITPPPDTLIQTLQAENALLKQQLEQTAQRTATLENRIEQLLAQMEQITRQQSLGTQTPQADRNPETGSLTSGASVASRNLEPLSAIPHAAASASVDISHLERLIRDTGERLNERLNNLDQRLHSLEETKKAKKARKKPMRRHLPPELDDTSSTLQSDHDM